MRSNRCSDDPLLDLAHGEPFWFRRASLRLHLIFCAECRTRQAELESIRHAWRASERPAAPLTPDRVEAARARFLARVSSEAPAVPARRRRVPAALALAASVSCVLVAGIGVWRYERAATPQIAPRQLAARLTIPAVRVAAPQPAFTAVVEPPTTPASPAISAADAEVRVLWIVHAQGLCTQGNVDVKMETPDQLTVRGVMDSTADREKLVALLEAGAEGYRLVFDLRTPEQVPAIAPTTIATPAPGAPPAGEAMLQSYLRSRNLSADERTREFIRISNEAVRLAGALSAESWALRRADERSAALAASVQREESRRHLAALRAAHLAGLEQALAATQELLDPLIGAASAAPARLDRIGPLAALIQDTFAGTLNSQTSLDQVKANLQTWLAESLAAARQRQ